MTGAVAEGPARRASRIVDAEAAVGRVSDGMVIGVGGFINTSHPMVVVRGLIRRGVKDLVVVGAASSGLEVDLLIAAGCVRKVVAPYVGGEALAPIGPAFRAAAEAGRLEVFELDEAMYYCGLRAAAQRVPFNPWKAGLGTSFPEVNPALKVFQDPIKGEAVLAVPAIDIDVAFLHAACSDAFGNVQHIGHGYGDRAIYAAADETYVQVEKIVSNEEIRSDPSKTSIPGATGVIRAPFGAHPFSSPGFYGEDRELIREYVKAATRWGKEGDVSDLRRFIDVYIAEPEDHPAYLERIGIRRLLSLHEF